MKIFEIEIFQFMGPIWFNSVIFFLLRLVCIFGASRTLLKETQLVIF